MKAKEFLNRAFFVNQRITSKIEQIKSLESLATKVTTTFSVVPASGSRNNHKLEDVITRIVAMEDELRDAIKELLDVKAEIARTIGMVETNEYRTILELRYLCLQSWEEIAHNMHFCHSNVYRVHGEALKEFSKIYNRIE